MEFPIVYKAEGAKKTKLVIVMIILGIALTAMGFKMKMDQPVGEGSLGVAYLGFFFIGMAILLFFLGRVREKQEANTRYIVERDCFIHFQKNQEDRFNYSDYVFSGKIQRTNGNLFLTMIMEDRNGKKHKRVLQMYEDSFRNLLDDISTASMLFLNPQGDQ